MGKTANIYSHIDSERKKASASVIRYVLCKRIKNKPEVVMKFTYQKSVFDAVFFDAVHSVPHGVIVPKLKGVSG